MTAARQLGRRRVLAIFAVAGGLPMWSTRSDAIPTWSWEGDALGAAARIRLCHPDKVTARVLVEDCVAELRRLEAAFSLYRADSELSRLNRDGYIDSPSRDLVDLMRQAQAWGARTRGAFDATVQPLWRLYADHFARHPDDLSGPPAPALDTARACVDYRAVDISVRRIAFARPGMAVTLNGIAQGYITDHVAARLHHGDVDATLIEMGEVAARGLRGDGSPWSVGVPDRAGGLAVTLPLRDRAMATSAGFATPFEPTQRFHHLFDPRSGACANHVGAVSVIAANATTADALSTALFATPIADAPALLRHTNAAREAAEIIVQGLDGRLHRLTAGQSTDSSISIQPKQGAIP